MHVWSHKHTCKFVKCNFLVIPRCLFITPNEPHGKWILHEWCTPFCHTHTVHNCLPSTSIISNTQPLSLLHTRCNVEGFISHGLVQEDNLGRCWWTKSCVITPTLHSSSAAPLHFILGIWSSLWAGVGTCRHKHAKWSKCSVLIHSL